MNFFQAQFDVYLHTRNKMKQSHSLMHTVLTQTLEHADLRLHNILSLDGHCVRIGSYSLIHSPLINHIFLFIRCMMSSGQSHSGPNFRSKITNAVIGPPFSHVMEFTLWMAENTVVFLFGSLSSIPNAGCWKL